MLGLIGQPRLESHGGKTILHIEQAMITVNKIGRERGCHSHQLRSYSINRRSSSGFRRW
jgi:hypothetical protein